MASLIIYQRGILWIIIGIYFLSWLIFLLGIIFDKSATLPRAKQACFTAVTLHAAWIILRWIEVGHGPYLNLYEVASSDSITLIIIYLIGQYKYPKLTFLGVFVLPVVFLLMGFGSLSAKEPVALMPIMDSSWLLVHVATAKLAFGSYLVSAVLASAYLLKDKQKEGKLLNRFPSNPINEEMNRKFVTLGFLNHTVMLVSGSIWANVAFGSYWSWDAIEIWSLISWLIYGIYYHLITLHGWHGSQMAWMSLVAMFSMVFSLFGVPFLFTGSHNLFM